MPLGIFTNLLFIRKEGPISGSHLRKAHAQNRKRVKGRSNDLSSIDVQLPRKRHMRIHRRTQCGLFRHGAVHQQELLGRRYEGSESAGRQTLKCMRITVGISRNLSITDSQSSLRRWTRRLWTTDQELLHTIRPCSHDLVVSIIYKQLKHIHPQRSRPAESLCKNTAAT